MRILKVSHTIEEGTLKKILAALKKGNVLAFPTDTVYGFVGDARNPKTLRKIFQIKQRDLKKPIGIFVKDITMAKRFAKVSLLQEKFLKKVWPGKVTAVLASKHKLPKILEKEGKIGLRVPNYKLLGIVFAEYPWPLAQTSANIAESPSIMNGKRIATVFAKRKHKPDLVIDAGKLETSKPSTVVDLTGPTQRIIRK